MAPHAEGSARLLGQEFRNPQMLLESSHHVHRVNQLAFTCLAPQVGHNPDGQQGLLLAF